MNIMLGQLVDLMEVQADGLVSLQPVVQAPLLTGRYDLSRAVTERTSSPLIIEADMTDSRVYSEAQVRERVEAFIEDL
jgi:benzoyl-CoA reductase/2-hydroxyglutaryl-CoA dehydratase subunit BcrC/BadD/HgdB